MTQAIDVIGNTAAQSLDFLHNELKVPELWVPDGAGELASDFKSFAMAMGVMEGLKHDPAKGFFRVPADQNEAAIRQQYDQLVAIETKDDQGNVGLFPAIILRPGKDPNQLRFGVLNTGPYKENTGDTNPGDRLAPGAAPTAEQAFKLYLMNVKEARGAGAHDTTGQATPADIVHAGVSLGVVTQPEWALNPHKVVHELAGTRNQAGTGTSAGLAKAGLTSVTGHGSERVVVNPSHIYWSPSFVDSKRPPQDLLEQYSGTELVLAVGVAALRAREIPGPKLKTEIAAGIAAVKKNIKRV